MPAALVPMFLPLNFGPMNTNRLGLFIAKRLNQNPSSRFSAIIYSVAVASVALGVGLMLIAFLVLGGFQRAVQQKLFSFGGHFQITRFSLSNSYEEEPLDLQQAFSVPPTSLNTVKHVQPFAYKAGLLKTATEVQGVLLKGVDATFDTAQFAQNMVAGRFVRFDTTQRYSREVLLSRRMANLLQLEVDSTAVLYFVQNPPRFRKLKVVGIYSTGLEEFDDRILIGDIDLIRQLNGWQPQQAGGIEVFINDFDQLDKAFAELDLVTAPQLRVRSVINRFLQLFDWLALLNRNVVIFLTVIFFVAGFNMVSTLLILIMERTGMIGLLKAMGGSNRLIRRIFVFNGLRLTVKGLLIGNTLALGFGALQYYLHVIPLDPENYYMDFVPVYWDWPVLLAVNGGAVLLISLVLYIPTFLISRIRPIKAIRFN